jgi:hypothetical protein
MKSPLDRSARHQKEDLRKLSHSPVEINKNYELSEDNTSKLWMNFEDHIKNSLHGKASKFLNPKAGVR